MDFNFSARNDDWQKKYMNIPQNEFLYFLQSPNWFKMVININEKKNIRKK